MAVTQIDGGRQIKTGTITNAEISTDAAIALSKLAEAVIQADGGQAFTANQSMGGFKLTSLDDGTDPGDAVNLSQLEAAVAAIASGSAKDAVRAATTASITLSGTQTIDGVALSAGDRVFVKNQTAPEENGVYVVAAGAWTRSTDTDTWNELVSAIIPVSEGTVNGDSLWLITADRGGTLGTTAVTSFQLPGPSDILAGDGLVRTGKTIDLVAADTSLVVGANDVAVTGVTTLLSRLSALRAGYLDNLSAGAAALESSLQALITTVGAAGAGLTATVSAVWSAATRVLTAGTNIVLAKGTGITGFNDLSAAEVNAEVDAALIDYDGPTHSELTAELATADDVVLAAIGSLNNLSQANVRSAVGLASANLDTQLTAIDDFLDTEVAAIKAKTDNLPASPAAVSDIPTADEIADSVWSTPFPSAGILDDFNRADEGPPPSANWTTGIANGFGGFIEPGHSVTGNQLNNDFNDVAQNYWNVEQFGPDCEAYITVVDVQGLISVGLAARLTDIGRFTCEGYAVQINPSGGGLNRTYQTYRIDNGALTLLANTTENGVGSMNGDKYGIRCQGNVIELWGDTGGGWEIKLSATDSTYSTVGFIGVVTEVDPLSRFDDFGGGDIPDFAARRRAVVADAVWDEDIVDDHQDADTAGKKLSQALILYEGS